MRLRLRVDARDQVIFAGSELGDASLLSECNVEDGSTLFLVGRGDRSVSVLVKTLKVKHDLKFA